MKLDYITNLRIPSTKANSVQVMQNCEAFKKAGLKVSLIVPFRFGTYKEQPVENIWDYYNIDKRFPVKKVFCIDLFPLRVIELFAFWLQSLSFFVMIGILYLIKKPDVIYTRDAWLGLFLFYKKNKILELHNFPQRSIGKRIYKFLVNRFDKVIVISKGLQKEVPNAFVAPDGVKIDQFDLDISRDEARVKLSLPANDKIVMYTGSLQRWKGISSLVEASNSLDAKVYIVGGTLDPDDLEDLGSSSNAFFIGHISHKDIPYYLKAADVLVIPNTGESAISANYTSPLKAFEYMAADRPVVSSDLASLMEIFNEDNAYIFKAGDSADLARAIKEAIDGEKRADPSGYCWDARVKKILDHIT